MSSKHNQQPESDGPSDMAERLPNSTEAHLAFTGCRNNPEIMELLGSTTLAISFALSEEAIDMPSLILGGREYIGKDDVIAALSAHASSIAN